jgi:hypothetical protein
MIKLALKALQKMLSTVTLAVQQALASMSSALGINRIVSICCCIGQLSQ